MYRARDAVHEALQLCLPLRLGLGEPWREAKSIRRAETGSLCSPTPLEDIDGHTPPLRYPYKLFLSDVVGVEAGMVSLPLLPSKITSG